MRKPTGVPRDEWLLAIGLASFTWDARDAEMKVAKAIAGDVNSTDFLLASTEMGGAFDGCCDVTVENRCERIKDVDPDAYAAGAALAIALEK